MGTYVGVDWASRGWLTVVTDGQTWTAEMHPSMHSVWVAHRDAASILVDIPIGLPEASRRECDRRAKAQLSTAQARSVFWTPCREAVRADTYDDAKQANQVARGDKLSSQAWGLIPRIREVDLLMRDIPETQDTIRESHPEVCFDALSADQSIPSKHDEQGLEAREACLENCDESLDGGYADFVEEHIESRPAWTRRIGASNRDDLLDAMVLALTAKLGAGDYATLPDDPPTDEEDLPMEIVYATT